ncbi:hypothetical protein FB446DRAFT_461739 [Lentinula raphanica]|nr:hypothetical protein FB446DRAFT_461739 [Lentinula raphanica]
MLANIEFQLPHLNKDLSNWVIYKHRVATVIRSYGLGRHLEGNVRLPKQVIESDGEFYLRGSSTALTDDEYDKHMNEQDAYDAKEAQGKLRLMKLGRSSVLSWSAPLSQGPKA